MRRISDISAVAAEDSDCSFNISDLYNHTNREETPSIDRLNEKRSVSGSVGNRPQNEEAVLQSTPEVHPVSKSRGSEGPSKMRRVELTAEDCKENNPPRRSKTRVQSGKASGFVSSTPAVPPTSATKPAFYQRSPTPLISGSHQSTPPLDSHGNTSSLLSSIGTDNPSLTDLSNKLRSMGGKVVNKGGDVSGMTSGVSQQMLTPDTQNTLPTSSTSQPALSADPALSGGVPATILEAISALEKTLMSQARWVKTEVVRQACDTQFNLEDKLNALERRQVNMEEQLSNIAQDIAFIRNNM